MALTMRSLRQVVAVADHGSLSRAADELNVTQPALSRTVNQIEGRYAVQIFERTRNGMVLTPAGKEVIEEIRLIVRDVQNLERGMRIRGEGELGTISYGVTPMLAKLILPGTGAQTLIKRPGVRSRVSIEQTATLVHELVWDRLEFIICPSILFEPSDELLFEEIGTFRTFYFVRPGHPLASERELRIEDLERYPVAAAVEQPRRPERGAGDFICDNYDILRQVILGSDAVLSSSQSLSAVDLEMGALKRLDFEDFEAHETEILMVRRKARTISPIARFVQAEIKGILSIPE